MGILAHQAIKELSAHLGHLNCEDNRGILARLVMSAKTVTKVHKVYRASRHLMQQFPVDLDVMVNRAMMA